MSYLLGEADVNPTEANERNRLKDKHKEDQEGERRRCARFYIPLSVCLSVVCWLIMQGMGDPSTISCYLLFSSSTPWITFQVFDHGPGYVALQNYKCFSP